MRISRRGKVFGFRVGNQVNLGRTHREKYPPNTYFKDFLKRMKNKERRIWLKEFGEKISLSMKNNPEYLKKLQKRMIGNTYLQDYLENNPIWKKPNWDNHIPYKTVPEFVPIIKQKISSLQVIDYYNRGIIPKSVCSYLK